MTDGIGRIALDEGLATSHFEPVPGTGEAMPVFERQLIVPVPRSELHDWHMRDGAFERLGPPWQTLRSIRAEPVANGAKRIFEVKKGGIWLRWVADHQNVVDGEQFTDIQEKGPFKSWEHTHRFEPIDGDHSRLVDHIEYQVPGGFLGRALAGGAIESDVERMFTYRHRITRDDLRQHGRYLSRGHLRIAVSGASGMLGSQLVAFLRTGGHEVLRLVRHSDEPAADEVRWNKSDGIIDLEKLEELDGIVHLAGENIAQRWTDDAKKRILASRVEGTRAVVDAIGKLSSRPSVLVSASAVGFYGDTGDNVVDEAAPHGEGFLADVCEAWEAEARRASDFGVRVVNPRIGVVLDPRGGALAKLLPVFKTGLGGKVAGGEQLMSWVGLDDVLGALHFLLHEDSMVGPVNVTGGEPVTQGQMASTLGTVLSRPSIAPAPGAAIKMMYGEMGKETVLTSTGARPARLQDGGYGFRFSSLEALLRHCLGRGADSVSLEPS